MKTSRWRLGPLADGYNYTKKKVWCYYQVIAQHFQITVFALICRFGWVAVSTENLPSCERHQRLEGDGEWSADTKQDPAISITHHLMRVPCETKQGLRSRSGCLRSLPSAVGSTSASDLLDVYWLVLHGCSQVCIRGLPPYLKVLVSVFSNIHIYKPFSDKAVWVEDVCGLVTSLLWTLMRNNQV